MDFTNLKTLMATLACSFAFYGASASSPSDFSSLRKPLQAAHSPISVAPQSQQAITLNYKQVPQSRMIRVAAPNLPIAEAAFNQASAGISGAAPVYAVMMYSSEWTEESGTKKGVYSIPTDGTSTTPTPVKLESGVFTECGYAVGAPDKYHFAQTTKTYGVVTSLRQYTYNTADWSAGTALSGDLTTRNFTASDAAYDPLTTNIYASVVNSSDGLWGLYRISTETKIEFKKIAELNVPFSAMSFDNNGNLFAVTADGKFINYNIATASATTIADKLPVSTKYTSGTLDSTGTTFYYAMCNDSESALYTIEVATGKAQKMYDFANGEEFIGMYIPSATEVKAVPDAATGLTLTFEGGSLSGKISFTCPQNNIDSSVAEGELNYTVYASNLKVAEGKTAYGEKVELDVTLPRNGEYTVTVRLSNALGEGPAAKVNAWIGNDIPPKVTTAPKVTYANGKATISWYSPSSKTGVNGGYVDRTKYTYTVIRNNDGKVVADGISATKAEDEFEAPDSITLYTYNVIINYEGAQSVPMTSAVLPLGNIYPPFEVDFSSDPMAYFTTLDVNKDYKTWLYTSIYKRIHVSANTSKAMDDWLFTMPLKLKAGYAYQLTFDTYGGAKNKVQTMEVVMGTEPTPAGMTTDTIMPRQEYGNIEDTPLNITYNIEVPVDGIYYIGFHALSAMNNSYICLSNIKISKPTAFKSPTQVLNFEATPDMTGAFKANLSVTAPAVTYKGEALESLTAIVIRSGADIVTTITNPEPGKTYSYTHEVEKGGDMEYAATAVNEYGESQAVYTSAFIGHTVPVAPATASMVENHPGNITFTWSEVTKDVNGKSLDPSDITYSVMELDQDSYKWVARASKIKGLTHTMQVLKPTDEQDFLSLAIGAENEHGISKYRALPQVPIGVPYELPYIESNAGNALSHTFLTSKISGEGLVRWRQGNNSTIEGMVPADGDNGYLYMEGEAVGDKASLISGKITIGNATNPVMTVAYVGFPGDKNRVGINIICDGVEKTLNEWEASATSASWQEMAMKLDEYKGKTIQFVLYGELRTSKQVFVDLIKIIDYPDIDLAVSDIIAPAELTSGSSGEVKVLVENLGLNPVDNYTVSFYANNECIATAKSTAAIPFHGQAIYSCNIDATPLSDDVIKVYAHVNAAGDAIADNDKSKECAIAVTKPTLPAPENLTAEKINDGTGIKLTWTDADISSFSGAIAEDCESYEPFSISGFGNWSTIDADQSVSNAFSSFTVPHLGTDAFGFMVFDNSDSKFNSTYNAHSGTKYFMAFTNEAQQMDDWLISPELSGKAQTISFFARGYHPNYPESFEILYSATGKDIADFKALAVYKNVGYQFTEYTASLPEGSRYFAIRCTSQNGMMFIVDDITYSPKEFDLKVESYNIYRNGKLAASKVSAKEYIDTPETTGSFTYNVTACYNYGESTASNPATVDFITTGIDGVESQANGVTVNGHKIIITAPAGSKVAIYTIAGVMLYSETTGGTTEFEVLPGAYVVTTGNNAVKVIVK